MGVYDILAEQYNEIFPLTLSRIDFIKSFPIPGNAKILDIGCAVGDLAAALSKLNYSVTGIDVNEAMISLAKKKAYEENLNITFLATDMLRIDTLNIGPFNLISCFGNTLPHLSTCKDIQDFFLKVFSVLCSSGIFVFQILNYDKIMSEKKITFPAKETENFVFNRNYIFRKDGKIDFYVFLLDKRSGEELRDCTCLLPLYRRRLMGDLDQTGFKKIKVFSGFNRTPANRDDFSLLYVAEKE